MRCDRFITAFRWVLLGLLAGDAASAPLNKCTLPDGRVEFTDRACPAQASSVATESKIPPQSRPQTAPQQTVPDTASGLPSRRLPAEDRLKSCDPSIALAAAEEMVADPASMKEPLQLFSAASALFQHGKKDEGVFWFYAAQLRVRQQLVLEKGDRGQLLSIMLMTVGPPVNNYAFQNITRLDRILDRVLEWDKATPNPFRDKARVERLDAQIDKVYAGFADLRTKLAAEKASLETAARQAAPGIEQAHAQMNSQRCRKGQADPSLERQTIEDEWLQATEFVKNNKDAIREVGAIKRVGRESSKTKAGETLPSRYIVSVSADKAAYAVVDVNRSAGHARFTLACLTRLSLGMRDPFKDECKQ